MQTPCLCPVTLTKQKQKPNIEEETLLEKTKYLQKLAECYPL